MHSPSSSSVVSLPPATRLLALCLTLSLIVANVGYGKEPGAIFQANQKLGRGINLGNYLEPPRNANWSVKIEPKHLEVIKNRGFDSIRIPVKWSDYADAKAPYIIEASFFERIDLLLEKAHDVGLNVVLNIHHYDGLDNEPEEHRDRFVALWKQIATRYKDRGDWLYFELNNEPHAKLSDKWNDYLLLGLAAVRESNPVRPVIIGPPHWNGIWALPQLKLPADENIIVTVHMYNPHEFTHQGASWADERVRSLKNLAWGTEDEVSAVKKELALAAEWGKKNHRPIYLGEFGAFEAAPLESRIKWTRTVAREAEKLQMSWAYWEFGAGFSAYDLGSEKWRPELSDALLPSTAEKN